MKNLLLLSFTLLSITILSCKKSDNDAKFDFRIDGVKNTALISNNSYNYVTLPIDVVLVSGPQEQVTLSLSGVPKEIETEIQSAVGTVNYSTIISFRRSFGNDPKQIIPIKIIGTSKSGIIHTYDMDLSFD